MKKINLVLGLVALAFFMPVHSLAAEAMIHQEHTHGHTDEKKEENKSEDVSKKDKKNKKKKLKKRKLTEDELRQLREQLNIMINEGKITTEEAERLYAEAVKGEFIDPKEEWEQLTQEEKLDKYKKMIGRLVQENLITESLAAEKIKEAEQGNFDFDIFINNR